MSDLAAQPDRPVWCGTIRGSIHTSFTDGPSYLTALGRSRVGSTTVGSISTADMTAWLLVVGLAGHGLKDLWQHRRQFVANTRWWPPFCLVANWVTATIVVVAILAGAQFHH